MRASDYRDGFSAIRDLAAILYASDALLAANSDSGSAEYRVAYAAESNDLLRHYHSMTDESPVSSDADLLAEWSADRGTHRFDTPAQLAIIQSPVFLSALRSRHEERMNPQPLTLCRTCGVMAHGEHRHGQRSTS